MKIQGLLSKLGVIFTLFTAFVIFTSEIHSSHAGFKITTTSVDKTELNKVINNAKEKLKEAHKYEKKSIRILKRHIKKSEKILNHQKVSQKFIDRYTQILENFLNSLKEIEITTRYFFSTSGNYYSDTGKFSPEINIKKQLASKGVTGFFHYSLYNGSTLPSGLKLRGGSIKGKIDVKKHTSGVYANPQILVSGFNTQRQYVNIVVMQRIDLRRVQVNNSNKILKLSTNNTTIDSFPFGTNSTTLYKKPRRGSLNINNKNRQIEYTYTGKKKNGIIDRFTVRYFMRGVIQSITYTVEK